MQYGSSVTSLPPDDDLCKVEAKAQETTPRSVMGQFEDAIDDGPRDKGQALAFLANAASSIPAVPPPSRLQRRISTNTDEATRALLGLASGAPQQRKKKKTFVVRLEEIKEYLERHGRAPPAREATIRDEPWEQNLLHWLQDCRRQYQDGHFSVEKAKALHDLGCDGFGDHKTPSYIQKAEEGQARYNRDISVAKPQHPALHALWLKRRGEARFQEESRRLELQRRTALAHARQSQDPDGAAPPPDSEMYPTDFPRPLPDMRAPNRLALEEMYAREQMAREAMVREQRLAQAMAARRMSLGYGGFSPASQPSLIHQGRVMSLLQPIESAPPRGVTSLSGVNYGDRRVSALLQAQMMQRRAAAMRRPSDPTIEDLRSWDAHMKEMWAFFLTYGHTDVPTRGDHQELGHWLCNARLALRDGHLAPQQAKEFLAMEEWTLEDGAPNQSTDPDSEVRGAPKQGSRGSEEVRASSKGITKSPRTTKSQRALPRSWQQSFSDLQDFKARFGHCDVKMIVNSPYGLLGKWLASQRSRHKLGQLPMDKVQRLRDLGAAGFGNPSQHQSYPRSEYRADDEEAEFDAAIRKLRSGNADDHEPTDLQSPPGSVPCSPATREKRVRHSYETRVEHIKAFKIKHGHCKIRLGCLDKHEELLARWLASARSRYRGGQFKEERAQELRELGCDGFEPLGSDASSATTTANEEGSLSSSHKRPTSTRTATPSPTPELEQEYGASEPPSKKHRGGGKRQSFDDMLKELESYQYVFGVGCSVPKPDGDKGKLGRWLAFQRRSFIAGKLSEERIAKLKAIGRKEFNQSALIVRAAERAAAGMNAHQ